MGGGGVRGNRHHRLRARRTDRTSALVTPPRRSGRAVRGHRPGRRQGTRLLATVGFPPGGRGRRGPRDDDGEAGLALRHHRPAMAPSGCRGGGAWNPGPRRRSGGVYVGVANPAPWGGSKRFPNGGWYAAVTLYTDSLVVLDGTTGKVVWYDQVLRTTSATTTSTSHPRACLRSAVEGPPDDLRGWQGRPRDRLGPHAQPRLGATRRTDLNDVGPPRDRRPSSARGSSAACSVRWRTRWGRCSFRSSTCACGRARSAPRACCNDRRPTGRARSMPSMP